MAAPDSPIDPTHALDDFIAQRRAEQQASHKAPELDDLLAKLGSAPAGAAARPKGGVLRDGTIWRGDDVVDVPLVELPQVDAQADAARAAELPRIELPKVETPDPEFAKAVAESTGQATALAAAMWLAEARAAAGTVPQPDFSRLQPKPEKHPRVLDDWRTGAWIGARRLAVAATSEITGSAQGPTIVSYPAQHLVVLWTPTRPDAPHLGRWPRKAFLSAAPANALDQSALDQMPEESLLWWLPAHSDLPDWALAAEIVLIHDSALRPFQVTALKALVEQERSAALGRVNQAYHRPEDGEAVQRKT
jgi:hypothetical protein